LNEECISTITIAHLRDSEGYNKTWFDEENVPRDTVYNNYFLTLPAGGIGGSYLYFTVET
jgi:hypothetical protein